LKLVCSFWQIAKLQEFFINYRIGSHKHFDKLLLLPFLLLLLLLSSFFFRDEELGWMDDEKQYEMNGWKGRPNRQT
jgi:hypothetical protein